MKLSKAAGPCWSKAAMDKVAESLFKAHGMDIRRFDETFLETSLEKRMVATSTETSAAYIQRLTHDIAEAEEFFHSLNIGYSEFFRDPLAFAVLEQLVLPSIIEDKARDSRGKIRVWSAGSSTGQEAWSTAILLDEATAARAHSVPFQIFATDISLSDLAYARDGVYDKAAIRNIRMRHLNRFFVRQGQFYTISPRLRELVDFSVYNLLDEGSSSPAASIFGDFDLALCCNLLMYYRPDTQHFILDKVLHSLSPKGYLVTGAAERSIVQHTNGFRAVAAPAAVFQKRR